MEGGILAGRRLWSALRLRRVNRFLWHNRSMAKARKILQKALSGSKNIRFGDFVKLIEAFGFVPERITGSHHIFSHPDVPQTISAQPYPHNQAKPYQVKQFLKVVEQYELTLDDEAAEEDEA
jgi:predicted RNA binding protein YcfA (HicA-like mRNA interferase family)